MFDWKDASTDELALHIVDLPSANVHTQVAYYKRKGDEGMLTKIENARKIAKALRLRRRAESILKSCTDTGGV